MAKGAGIIARRAVLDAIAEHDAAEHERLVTLRGTHPQAYRKALRGVARRLDALHGTDLSGQLPAKRTRLPSPPAPDLTVLDGSVGEVKKALGSGDHDGALAALLAAEQAGKARKGVLTAIRSRM